jgi:ABC-type dipeptide/oligopeptide/nickel transport system ATPase component
VAFIETAKERIFLMKDLAVVEEAIELVAVVYKGEVEVSSRALIKNRDFI